MRITAYLGPALARVTKPAFLPVVAHMGERQGAHKIKPEGLFDSECRSNFKYMKILNKQQMLDAPENTLFFKWEPNLLSEFGIKTGNRGDSDIWTAEFTCGFNEYKLPVNAKQFPWELSSCSFGIIEEDDQFVVFENHEIEALIEDLKKCIKQ